jgi:hypothetical protein
MRSCRWEMVLLLALTALARQSVAVEIDSRESAINEYLIAGTVVWIHAGSSSIAIRGSSLLGHLHIGVKSYRVKQPRALADLHPGDAITAVFSGKDGMLHRLRRVRKAWGDTH